MDVLRENGEPAGSPAAVLIVRDNLSHAQQLWADVKERTAEWSAADPGTIDALLVAALYALHAELGSP
jgi:hypothetical protein